MVFYAGKVKENKEGEKNRYDSKNGQEDKYQSLIKLSSRVINTLKNTQGK